MGLAYGRKRKILLPPLFRLASTTAFQACKHSQEERGRKYISIISWHSCRTKLCWSCMNAE